jgi:GNAT superfamily N-acetyltransferase
MHQLRLEPCTNDTEWKTARSYRQKYFFDKQPIDDPYTWTFDHKDHQHFVLYQGADIIGYAHILLWPEDRAAIRIIVIDEPKRHQGYGTAFMDQIEERLKHQGYRTLHAESSPDAYPFYIKRGYTHMPFNDPDGYEGGSPDIAVGKLLSISTLSHL